MKKFCASLHSSCLVWLLMTLKPGFLGMTGLRSYVGNVTEIPRKIDEEAHFKFTNKHY